MIVVTDEKLRFQAPGKADSRPGYCELTGGGR